MKVMTKLMRAAAIAVVAAAAAVACSTPKNIVYFQDMGNASELTPNGASSIRLQPMDQISIIVNSRDPQVTSMFNMPYYSSMIGAQQSLTANSTVGSSSGQGRISGYTIDANGNIDFPIIGKINLAGLTREEAEAYVKRILIESKQIKDPVVTIEFMNLGFSVLGEVTRPGRYRIDRDRYTILDALGMAGDLTINGLRENVTLVRHDAASGKDTVYKLNLLKSNEVYSSPAFYIQQGDIIYVTPNNKRLRESRANGNAAYTTSFWISLASLAATITSVTLTVLNNLE